VSESGSGGDLATAYQSLLSAMQANGETSDATASQLKDALSQLENKSQDGSTDATVSGGTMLVQAGGPVQFNGISAYQNGFVDSVINDLTSQLDCVKLPATECDTTHCPCALSPAAFRLGRLRPALAGA
jgi:hypothetical protein